ncbi:MAG TPA: TraB/GumN family protein [Vicinamibacterales bacterium]|jgi:uncharacterized protein|nr:TraB/GumN family protein [Vicinamibacterales bacterium]
MRRHALIGRFLATFSIAVVLASGAVAQTRGRNFLWKVQSGTNVMYLAGSVHALTADVYPLNPAYQRAFDASGALVEEINLAEADPLSGGLGLLAKGMYQDGRTFNSAVSGETLAMVEQKLKDTPLAIDLIQPMKPWMVMLMIEALGAQTAGLDPQLGLDKHFYDLANDKGKQVIGLETAESQIDRFDKMPERMQEQMLRSELAEMETEQSSLRGILTAWQNGDAAAIEKMLLGSFRDNPAAYDSLINERNRNWMPQLEACLKRSSPCFVVVGAAHVVGPQGLLAMLQQRGYRIEQQ